MSRSARAVLALILAALCLFALCSCHRPDSGGITVAGSTSVQPIAELLADRYMAEHPGAVINVQGGGSSAGVRAAMTGAAQIGMASRNLKPDETGLQTFLLARDAIALIVHPSNPIRALSKAQARDIFSGRIRNWQELGGPPGVITCITREEGSGTRTAFEDMVMGKDTEISGDCIVQDSTGAARALVAGDRNGIAYVSLGMVTPEVAAITLEGVVPSHEAVLAGKYPLTRPFLLLTKGAPSPAAQAYIDFVMSPPSQATILEEGYVPVHSTHQP